VEWEGIPAIPVTGFLNFTGAGTTSCKHPFWVNLQKWLHGLKIILEIFWAGTGVLDGGKTGPEFLRKSIFSKKWKFIF